MTRFMAVKLWRGLREEGLRRAVCGRRLDSGRLGRGAHETEGKSALGSKNIDSSLRLFWQVDMDGTDLTRHRVVCRGITRERLRSLLEGQERRLFCPACRESGICCDL